MAFPFDPADPFLGLSPVDTDLLPPTPGANGAPTADEGSDQREECGTLAAPKFPAVGRQDDGHKGQKKYTAPVRDRRDWLSSVALALTTTARAQAQAAATTIGDRRAVAGPPYPSHHQPYPNNHYPVTTGPHSSCSLCGTPYPGQLNSSGRGRGPSHAPRPSVTTRHEQTRDGSRCPACFCPTTTQPSPTGAQTRFLSSGRGEYITGYRPSLSSSQPYLGGVGTAYANTSNTGRGEYIAGYQPSLSSSRPYLGGVGTAYANTSNTPLPSRPSADFYRGAAMTSTSDSVYQLFPAERRISERTLTRAETRTSGRFPPAESPWQISDDVSIPSTVYLPAPANRGSRQDAYALTQKTVGVSLNSITMPASERRTATMPSVSSARSSSNGVTSQGGQAGGFAAYSGSTNEALVSDVIARGFIKSDAVADVMRAVDRAHYVTDKAKAYSSVTHFTELGVTFHAPHIHAAILESILPYIKAGSHVLDVGASTGVFAAMLYHRTGQDGLVISLTPSTETYDLAKQNLIVDGLGGALLKGRIQLVKGDEKSGFAPCAPYDVIHVTKVMEEIPPQLLTQLATPGRMMIPVRTDGREAMIQVDKDAAGDVSQKELSSLL